MFFYTFLVLSLPFWRGALLGPDARKIKTPLIFWIFAIFFSAAVSIEPLRSFQEAFKTLLYLFLPFALNEYLNRFLSSSERIDEAIKILFCLAAGQSIAALHTIISMGVGNPLSVGLPGEVTESGQLALVIPIVLGIVLSLKDREVFKKQRALGSLLALCLILIGWGEKLNEHLGWLFQTIAVGGGLIVAWKLRFFQSIKKLFSPGIFEERIISLGFLSLLSAAFLFNLKRGPWLGVFVSFVIVGYLLQRKMVFRTVLLFLLAICGLAPVRDRLLNFAADFSIIGGRQRMWELGIELASRFPLGLGLKNVDYMRTLDPYLPPTHRHMHNNFLNVLVETGFIGAVIYIWLMVALIWTGLRWSDVARKGGERLATLQVFLGGAILSWQCAGVVEYNFGDAEIRMIAFFLMGFLIVFDRILSERQSSSPQ